jgi:hypothetical protein
MEHEHDPHSTPSEDAPDETSEREAQSEDPTSPERGFEDVEHHDDEKEES